MSGTKSSVPNDFEEQEHAEHESEVADAIDE